LPHPRNHLLNLKNRAMFRLGLHLATPDSNGVTGPKLYDRRPGSRRTAVKLPEPVPPTAEYDAIDSILIFLR
jgi:hypothetical protein